MTKDRGTRAAHANPETDGDGNFYRILFVCTGNTCRSPMAEAIASDLLKQYPEHAKKIKVESAGTSAVDGLPISPEAVQAVRSLGVDYDFNPSRRLTHERTRQADVIFAMTRSHTDAIYDIDPDATSKVKKLDPSGGDVSDPIGQGQDVYHQTAMNMREMIASRLKELLS